MGPKPKIVFEANVQHPKNTILEQLSVVSWFIFVIHRTKLILIFCALCSQSTILAVVILDDIKPEIKQEFQASVEEPQEFQALSPKREYQAVKNSPGTPTVDELAKHEPLHEDSFCPRDSEIKSESVCDGKDVTDTGLSVEET